MAKRILKQILKNGNEYEVGNLKAYTVTEDKTTVTTEATQGVSPYDTSYGYTNITIDESSGIKWKEGAIYSFVVNTEMVVDSSKRNVRVRIGSNGSWIPVMNGAGTILNGNEFMKKSNTVLFVYKTTYQSTGALHSIYSSLSGLPAGGQPGQMIMMTSNGAKWFDVASPTAISLDESSIQLNTVGATQQLTATVTPSTAVVTQVEWSSSDTTIATVSSSGLVTCVTPGNATITASTVNGLTATCSVTEGGGWQPGANTLVYLSLDGDANDGSGNSHNGTLPANYSWEDIIDSSKKCFHVTSNGGYITGTYGTALGSGDRTLSIWLKFGNIDSRQTTDIFIGKTSGGTQGERFGLWHNNESSTMLGILRYYDDPYTNSFTYDTNRHNYVITYNDTNKSKVYVDGQQVIMTNSPNVSFNTLGTTYLVGNFRSYGSWSKYLSEFIIENKERTAQEVSEYFNATKGNYGII